ncbi:MAG: AAA family ATPase, partial [Acidobacteriota bacterium]
AEGIGPFKSVHLDLRGADGKASNGPHILAGVNGSGKSTLLKAIAWNHADDKDGFPLEEWQSYFAADWSSRVLSVFERDGETWARETKRDWDSDDSWATEKLASVGLSGLCSLVDTQTSSWGVRTVWTERWGRGLALIGSLATGGNMAAYSPARALHHLAPLNLASGPSFHKNSLSFDSTIDNEAVQAWLVTLYSRRAIAKERHQETEKYTATFRALEEGLRRVCGDHVSIVVDIEPRLQPRLKIGDQVLTFSQIPDGVKSTLGWLADFMMRADTLIAGDRDDGIMLFDEIETFLHPLWQRRILPAMTAALPETQFIVSSHSPFVISSHRDAMIHVLKIGKDGHAYAEPPVKAPIGESITSTLKEIFGVDSRFDVETEQELAEWNDLQKAKTSGKLSHKEQTRLKVLSETLASRSEELRSLVNPISKLSKDTVDQLTSSPAGRSNRPKRVASR